jgi:hypothetical protein
VQRPRTNLRHNLRRRSRHNREEGIVIALVAAFMVIVIGAMMALSIDVVSFYTARSEAQLAADSAALAAARVLANSGATYNPALLALAVGPAENIARQVAYQNQVGGAYLTVANVPPFFFGIVPPTNPTVKVTVHANLPTFFARMLGTRFVTVAASATAEAYNPSGAEAYSGSPAIPVAPICVKPWLLPNMSPTTAGVQIFDPASGAIIDSTLLGWTSPPGKMLTLNALACPGGTCTAPTSPASWQYYPGDPGNFPPPPIPAPSCPSSLTTPYQESIAGCIQTPISCNSSANVDLGAYPNPGPGPPNRDSDTADAVNCLTHATATLNDADQVDLTAPDPPFQFLAGAKNPVAGAAGSDVMVSDSLVTVPVYDSTATTNPLQIIGFVQLFLNPDGQEAPALTGGVNTTVINLAGCGNTATGTPIYGNGASPVAVRLISSP